MILDLQTKLSAAQALTATAVSTNVLDNAVAGNFFGNGEDLMIELTVDVAADHTTGDETYQFDLVETATSDLTASPTVIQTRIIDFSLLTLGSKHYFPIPPAAGKLRFFGISYVLGGTTPTITVSASVMPADGIQNEKVFASGFTVS